MQKLPAKILIVDDDADVLTAARVVLRQLYESVNTETSPQRLPALLEQNQYDVILLDMNFSAGRITGNEGLFWLKQILTIRPQQQVVMVTAYGDIQLAVEAMKHGAADFIVKPWENEKLEATVHASYQHALAMKEISSLKKKQENYSRVVNEPDAEIIGNSPSFNLVLSTSEKVASSDANVLLLGENGTGKELIAKLIHRKSLRKNEPFIKVDVGAISSSLFESELFGYKKGAFTDAWEDKIGRLELANGGTLFLDEVGNLPQPLQAKLLSVLQNRNLIPLGSNAPVEVDVRLICATNLDLHRAVTEGHFRQDLLYRINTVEITLPPLRHRQEDIALLAKHFLAVYTSRYRKGNKTLSEGAIIHLQKYSWPGNVRELQHAMERAVILSDHDNLTINDFALAVKYAITDENSEALSLEDMERKAILTAMQKHDGNLSKVAKALGVGRTTLYRKMARYGIAK